MPRLAGPAATQAGAQGWQPAEADSLSLYDLMLTVRELVHALHLMRLSAGRPPAAGGSGGSDPSSPGSVETAFGDSAAATSSALASRRPPEMAGRSGATPSPPVDASVG